jgi:hypothetical protein
MQVRPLNLCSALLCAVAIVAGASASDRATYAVGRSPSAEWRILGGNTRHAATSVALPADFVAPPSEWLPISREIADVRMSTPAHPW